MAHVLHVVAAVLMLAGVASAAFRPHGWPGVVPHLIATAAMLDSLTGTPVVAPVWWLGSVVAAIVGVAVHHRVRHRREATTAQVSRMAAGTCATLLMCALMLPATVTSTGHHGGNSGSVLRPLAVFAFAGVACGVVCVARSVDVFRSGAEPHAAVEVGAMGGSVIAMSLLELLRA